jgi:folylpolyglutamate synthase/dihydropteroate synthase
VVATRGDAARALPAADLAARWRAVAGPGAGPVEVAAEPRGAVTAALAAAPGPVVVAGSLYLVGAARALLVDDPDLRDPAAE